MDRKKYIGMEVRRESISIAVMNASGKIGIRSPEFGLFRYLLRALAGL